MRYSIALVASFGAAISACSMSVDPTAADSNGPSEKPAESQQRIIGGFEIDPNNSSVVKLNIVDDSGQGWLCSGVLITNLWVLTAKHCVVGTTYANQITVQMGSQVVTGNNNLTYSPNNQQDVAMFKLQSPLAMNGSTTGFHNDISTQTSFPSPYQNWTVCKGYGWSEYGLGVLRQDGYFYANTNPNLSLYLATSDNARPFEGDSGGPCFNIDNQIVGTMQESNVSDPGNSFILARGSAFAIWAAWTSIF